MAIEQNTTGLIHLTNGEKIAKYELLNLIKDIWRMGEITIKPSQGKSIDKSLKKSERFSFSVSSYKQMMIEQFDWMESKSCLYNEIYRK